MRTKSLMRHFAWGVLGLINQQASSQATQDDNLGGLGSFLGWNAGANQTLEVKNEANQPISFFTNNLERMRLYHTVSPVINSYPPLARDGSLVLSNLPNGFTPPRVPFSRLHLIDVGGNTNPNVVAPEAAFRRWMRNGVTFTGNRDHGYVGQKYWTNDSGAQLQDLSDMVLHWSNELAGEAGPDRLRFIFTTTRNTAMAFGSRSEEGLEAMRFTPVNDMTMNAGLGDFFRGNILDPSNVNERSFLTGSEAASRQA